MKLLPPLIALTLLCSPPARAIDLAALWDFSNPALSEQRFAQALAGARGDDALILRTQIARTHGLRRDFDRARAQLRDAEPELAAAGAEPRVRWQLEMGRTLASATHPPALRTPENAAQARIHYQAAWDQARAARLDALVIDAIHMLAFVDTAPADQLKWAREALAVTLSSTQPDAQRWEASIRNNLGLALHKLGRFNEALPQFQQALALREKGDNARATHIARWMVAWTLRSLQRHDEALALQLRLEREGDAAGKPDPFVFEELEALYRALNDEPRAQHYAARRRTVAP